MRSKNKWMYVIAGFGLAIILAIVLSVTFVAAGVVKFDLSDWMDNIDLENIDFDNLDWDIDDLPDNVKEKLKEYFKDELKNMSWEDVQEFLKNSELGDNPKIFILTGSATKIYDGEPLTCEKWDHIGQLSEGHSIKVETTGSQTVIGTGDNTANYWIYDESGNDVTSYYWVTVWTGDLIVTDENGYVDDGDSNELMMMAGALLAGALGYDKLDIDSERDLLTVYADSDGYIYLRNRSFGDYDGKDFSLAEVYNGGGAKQVFNPAAYCVPTAGSNSVAITILDKRLSTCIPYYSVDEYSLAGDVELNLNKIYYEVNYKEYDYLSSSVDPYTTSLTDYNAFVHSHYLNIDEALKEELKSLTNFSSNGKTLIQDVVEYVKNAATYNTDFPEIPEDEDTILYFLKQSKEGVCRHFAAAATMILRAYGIPARYTVGFLAKAVKDTPVKVTSECAHAWVEIYIDNVGWIQIDATPSGYNPPTGEEMFKHDYDQTPPDFSEIATEPIPEDDTELFKVVADKDGVLYFRQTSYGDYNGSGFTEIANKYSYVFDGTEDIFNQAVNAINGDENVANITLIQDMPYRLIPYYSTDIYKLTDDISLKTNEKTYSAHFKYYNYLYDDSVLTVSNLTSYNGYVKNHYLIIDDKLKVDLIDLTNFTTEGKTLIKDVANFVKSAAKYNLDFKPIPDGADTILYFLTESKEGICQHFAAAATMMYRAYGIPARYTVGYAVTASANQEIIVTSTDAHAWVEVYLNDIGWIQIEVTPEAESDYERTITITSENLSKVYDGDPLEVDIENVLFDLSQLKDGHKISATGIPEITHVSESGIYNAPDFVVLDEDGNDVTDEYIIDYENCGTLEITPQVVTISAKGQKKYDGTTSIDLDNDFSDEEAGCYFTVEGLQGEDDFSKTVLTGIESDDVGTYVLKDFIIENSSKLDVTSDYTVKFEGEYEITKREITVKTQGGFWLYDGAPHTEGYEIGGDGIAKNDKILDSDVTAILDVGTRTNEIAISIKRVSDGDDDGKDKTKNYKIDYKYDTLEITNIINIYSYDQEDLYDGETHFGEYSAKGYSNEFNTEFDVPENLEISYDAAYLIDAGKIENHRPSATTVKIGENDFTDNYQFNYDNGCTETLTVNTRPITVQSDNCEKVYDGTALINDKDLIVGGDYGLVEGHKISATFTESLLDKGYCDNEFTDVVITDGEDNDVTKNYSFDENEFIFGTLTVTAKVVYLKSGSSDKTYDGTALSGTGYQYSVDGGESYTVIGVFDVGTGDVISFTPSSIVNAGETKNELKDLKAKRNETEDVTENYEFLFKSEEDCGTLTVNKRNIKFRSDNAEKVFDGAPLTKNSAEVYIQSDKEGLAPNEKVGSYSFTGTQTDVGSSENTFTVNDIIRESDGKSTLSNYNIEEYQAGTLEVKPKTVYVKSASDWKYYDGTALVGKGYQYSIDGSSFEDAVNNGDGTYYFELYKGDKAEFSSVSITEVGSIKNEPQITVRNGVNDVTAKGNYDFNFSAGTLEIKEKPILPVIKITTDEKAQLTFIYNGDFHSVASDKVIVEKPDGWNCDIIYNNIKYVSESNKNRAAYVANVTDGKGNPLTENTDYYVDNTCGYLVVNKLVLYFESSDTTWAYDGEEHFGTGYKFGYSSSEINNIPSCDKSTGIYSATLSTGDEITFKAASISATGIKENKPTDITVKKGGKELSDNYYFVTDCGKLMVEKVTLRISSSGGEFTYDGEGHEGAGYAQTGLVESVHRIEFTPKSFINVWDSGKNIPTFDIYDSDNNPVDKYTYYEMDYSGCENITIKQCPLVISIKGEKTYDGEASINQTDMTVKYNVGGEDRNLFNNQSADIKVKLNSANAGKYDENNISYRNVEISENDTDVTGNYNITILLDFTINLRPIIVSTGNETRTYNGYNQCGTIISATNLVSGHEISATFTGYKHAGEYSNSIDIDTFKIKDGKGNNVTANYSFTENDFTFGKFTIHKKTVYITSASDTWTYDAQIHYGSGYKCVGYDDPNISGNIYTFTLEGTDVATFNAAKIIEPSTIKNAPQLNPVTAAAAADYDFNVGGCDTLTVERISVKRISDEYVSKEYSGSLEHIGNCRIQIVGNYNGTYWNFEKVKENLTDKGFTIEIKQASVESLNTLVPNIATIVAYKNGKDVTSEYFLYAGDETGHIEITPRSLTIDAPIFAISLEDGYRLECELSITSNGTCQIENLNIFDEDEKDISDNYNTITIDKDAKISEGSLVAGHQLKCKFTFESDGDGGYYIETISKQIYDANGTKVTGNYMLFAP